MSNTIVQYILLRTDLLKELGWSVGAIVAQACHASTAVLHIYKDDEHTVQYLYDMDNMHKVVLEVPNEGSLNTVAEKLKENSIAHKLWIEQPENIPTCIALKPYPKDEVKKYVPNEGSLNTVAEKLKENSIAHKLWIEQPENIPTCIALKPYPKDEVKKYVGKFKLLKLQMSSTE